MFQNHFTCVTWCFADVVYCSASFHKAKLWFAGIV
uniref:Uncharacterized protein n=1 Tax=Arundo donax TaxID=35708 RepID=A0A0A8ZPQ3_ARUDO